MGHKVHPVGFRLGIYRDWSAHWFAVRDYSKLLAEDLKIRNFLHRNYHEAGVSQVAIERTVNMVTITIHTSRPGIVIGRGGQRVEEIRKGLEAITSKRTQVNIQEINQPELDAYLVARHVADQLGKRVAFRRAMRQAGLRTMQAGAKGIKIVCGGRLGGTEIARREKVMLGRVPLQTLRADIDFGIAEAHTLLGRIGVKVWIYRGDVQIPSREEETLPEAEGQAVDAPAQTS